MVTPIIDPSRAPRLPSQRQEEKMEPLLFRIFAVSQSLIFAGRPVASLPNESFFLCSSIQGPKTAANQCPVGPPR